MSSEQFSEKPLPADRKRCPFCGEPLSRRGKVCWLCEQEYLQDVDSRRRPTAPLIKKSDNTVWVILGILALLLVAGLIFEGPGLLAAIVVMVVLAMARSAHASKLEKEVARTRKADADAPDISLPHDDEPDTRHPVVAAIGNACSGLALGLTLCVVFFGTFFVSCSAVMMGGMALTNAFGDQSGLIVAVLLLGIGGGFVLAIIVTNKVGRGISPRKG